MVSRNDSDKAWGRVDQSAYGKQPMIAGSARCYDPSDAGAISPTTPDYYSNIETNGSITAKRANVSRLRFLK
jgi:hypothetical protein